MFQSIMSKVFEGIEGVKVLVNDLLIWGETEEQHHSKLEKGAEQKLNKDKSQIKCKEISYVGHIIGRDELKPDPKKVEAIVNMAAPKDEELQRSSA